MKAITLHHDDTFEHKGRTFIVKIEADDRQEAPWEWNDGHGPVSDWRSYGYNQYPTKGPHERVLCRDRRSCRVYDWAEAMRIAKRDGWGLSDEARAALHNKLGRPPTKGEISAQAVQQDFDYLRRWCENQWHYVGVVVAHVPNGTEPRNVDVDYQYALWGIESDAYEYISEVAHELAAEATYEVEREARDLRSQLKETTAKVRELVADLRESAALRPSVCDAVRGTIRQQLSKRRDLRQLLFSLQEV